MTRGKPILSGTYYFELVKAPDGKLISWSVVIRTISAIDETDIQGQHHEYKGPYTVADARPIYEQMVAKHGDPVRRVW